MTSKIYNVETTGPGPVFVGNQKVKMYTSCIQEQKDQSKRFNREWKCLMENVFLETEQSQLALSRLQSHNIAFIIGRPGDGKTSLAKFLIHSSKSDGYKVVELDSWKDWRKCESLEEKKIVLIDDIFRVHNLMTDVEMWLKMHESMRTSLERGFLRLVITCTKHVYESASIPTNKKLFSDVFDMTQNQLTFVEKRDMLLHHMNLNKRDCSQLGQQPFGVLLLDIIGFPRCCQMFAENENLLKMELYFFANPKQHISDLIRLLSENDAPAYCALVFCMMDGGDLKDATFNVPEISDLQRKRNQAIIDACGCDNTVTITMVKRKAKSVLHTYLIRNATDDGFIFQHLTYVSAVAVHFEANSSNVVLNYADIHFLSNNIHLHDDALFSLSADKFQLLIDRIIVEIDINTVQVMIFTTELFNNYDFLRTFLLHLKKIDRLFSFLKQNDFMMMKRNLIVCPLFCCAMRVVFDPTEENLQYENIEATHIESVILGKQNSALVDVLCSDHMQIYLKCIAKCQNADGSVARNCLSFVLLWACDCNTTSLITELLASGADPNIHGSCYMTPLHCAVISGKQNNVILLLDHGANQSENALKLFPIHCAALCGNVDVINTLIADGADISSRDLTDSTSIFMAAMCGHTRAVELLLMHGANINDKCCDGLMPIHAAAMCDNSRLVSILAINNADIYAKDNRGFTPLMIASQNGNSHTVRQLITYHSRSSNLSHTLFIDATDDDGCTALHHSVIHDETDIMKILLDENACPRVSSNNENTPLHTAALKGNVGIVQYLITHHAPLSTKNKDGDTPIYIAANRGRAKVVDIFIKEGADVLTLNEKGQSIFHCASFEGHTDTVECLIKHGCPLEITDIHGMTPLLYAVMAGRKNVMTTLIKHGANKAATSNKGMNIFMCMLLSWKLEQINRHVTLDWL